MSEQMEAVYEKQAEQYPNLGANYFASHDIAEKFMQQFEAEQFKPLLEKFVDQFRERVWDDFATFLMSDTEGNLHIQIRQRVDRAIESLLAGNPNYIAQFVMPEHSSFGEQIRKAVAKAIPVELQDRRIKDLEEENKRLRESLEFSRARY